MNNGCCYRDIFVYNITEFSIINTKEILCEICSSMRCFIEYFEK